MRRMLCIERSRIAEGVEDPQITVIWIIKDFFYRLVGLTDGKVEFDNR